MTTIDAARLRHVLGHVPTCVVVVTALTPSGPVGLAVGSFTSVSLNPPLVGFLPARSSTTWPGIRAAGQFCVNVLADDQADLCQVFAQPGADRFAGRRWAPAPRSGAPILADVLAWVDCAIEGVADAGDHWFVTGRVAELDVQRAGRPLVFFRGGYESLA